MLTLRQHRSGDLSPILRCGACQRTLRLQDSWLAWSVEHLDAPAVWLHDGCYRGNLRAVLGGQRALVWRAVDVFSRLLRDTEARDASA
jgi:hypothetical protein